MPGWEQLPRRAQGAEKTSGLKLFQRKVAELEAFTGLKAAAPESQNSLPDTGRHRKIQNAALPRCRFAGLAGNVGFCPADGRGE